MPVEAHTTMHTRSRAPPCDVNYVGNIGRARDDLAVAFGLRSDDANVRSVEFAQDVFPP